MIKVFTNKYGLRNQDAGFLLFQDFMNINVGLNNMVFNEAKLQLYSYTEIPSQALNSQN